MTLPPSGAEDPMRGYAASGGYEQYPAAQYQYPVTPDPYASPDPYSSPPYAGNAGVVQPYSAAPQSGYQPTQQYPTQQYPGPMPPAVYPPQAAQGYAQGFGVDPATGLPFSDKSKVIAGILQLLPGALFGLGGIGRLYAGNVGLGTAQLIMTVVGWASFWIAVCGSVLIVPVVMIVFYFAAWVWFVVDGIVLMAGHPRDGEGRPLRS